jgi:hypothetical protein
MEVRNFSILWYFKQSDTYNLLTIVSNDVSTHMEVRNDIFHRLDICIRVIRLPIWHDQLFENPLLLVFQLLNYGRY